MSARYVRYLSNRPVTINKEFMLKFPLDPLLRRGALLALRESQLRLFLCEETFEAWS
jgi:hypothetical protein